MSESREPELDRVEGLVFFGPAGNRPGWAELRGGDAVVHRPGDEEG